MIDNFQNNLKKLKERKELTPKHSFMQPQTSKFNIYMFDLNSEVDSEYIAGLCKSYIEENFNEKLGNVNAKSSEYIKLKRNSFVGFENLFNVVKSKIKPIWGLPYTYIIDHFWFSIYNNGDSSDLHNHGGTDLACVYYASVPEDSAPLVIPTTGTEISIAPKQGMLVVMPGRCDHLVPKSEHSGERIIVAMNIIRENLLVDEDGRLGDDRI